MLKILRGKAASGNWPPGQVAASGCWLQVAAKCLQEAAQVAQVAAQVAASGCESTRHMHAL